MEKQIILKKEWFIQKNQDKIEDCYQFDQKNYLGKGQFGCVVKAVRKNTFSVCAIKIMKKKKIKDPSRLISQITIMKNLDHPNVVRLYQIFQTSEKIYLVMQYCQGGELFDRTVKNKRLTEDQARLIFRDVVYAVAYCHSRKICHRDLKPENILLLNNEPDSPIKIIDFGLSAIFNPKQGMKTKAGTCYYMSPQVLTGKYDELCDIWSLGVILYFLVSGVPPFYGQSEYQILQMIRKQQYTYDIEQFFGVSDQVKNLISLCLSPREKRITAEQMINHPWLKKVSQNEQMIKLSRSLFERFSRCSKLKIVILSYMATQLNFTQTTKYSKMFKQYDTNNDGFIQYFELQKLLHNSGIQQPEQIKNFIKRLDTQKNGKINYNQFLAATIKPAIYSNKEKVVAAFKLFDKKNKGLIGIQEFRAVLKDIIIDQAQWNKLIQQADPNVKDAINFDQFNHIMSK